MNEEETVQPIADDTADGATLVEKPGAPVIAADPIEITLEETPEETTTMTNRDASRQTPDDRAATAVAPAAISQRRGCVFLFLGAILGAIFGVTLSLAILLGLNGTLTFSQTDAQLRRALNDSGLRQDDMEDSLATRAAEVDALSTRIEQLGSQQAGVAGAMTAVSQDVTTMEAEVTAVYTAVTGLDERVDETEAQLETAAAAAESFQGFLGGLQALLNEVNPTTATSTPTALSPTPTPMNGPGTGTAVAPTATVLTTRTPQPTRTPLPLATPTTAVRPPSGN